SLQWQTRRLPVAQPTGVSPDVFVSGLVQRPVERDAGVTVGARAVDDDLLVGSYRPGQLVRRVEVLRAGDVLGPIRPLVEGLDQTESVTTLDLLPQLVPADGVEPPRRGAAGSQVSFRIQPERRGASSPNLRGNPCRTGALPPRPGAVAPRHRRATANDEGPPPVPYP